MSTPQHKYSLQQYVALNNIEHLQKLFKNEEFFARTVIDNRDDLRRLINDPLGAGARRLAEYDASIANAMEAMQNIAKAVQILEQGKRR